MLGPQCFNIFYTSPCNICSSLYFFRSDRTERQGRSEVGERRNSREAAEVVELPQSAAASARAVRHQLHDGVQPLLQARHLQAHHARAPATAAQWRRRREGGEVMTSLAFVSNSVLPLRRPVNRTLSPTRKPSFVDSLTTLSCTLHKRYINVLASRSISVANHDGQVMHSYTMCLCLKYSCW